MTRGQLRQILTSEMQQSDDPGARVRPRAISGQELQGRPQIGQSTRQRTAGSLCSQTESRGGSYAALEGPAQVAHLPSAFEPGGSSEDAEA